MTTYREILDEVLKNTSPSFFEAQKMPRNLLLKNMVPTLTRDECNRLAPIFQKLISGESLSDTDVELLDKSK